MSKTSDTADKIQEMMGQGQSMEQIMRDHPELASGWNEVAKRKLVKQPPRASGPSSPSPRPPRVSTSRP